MICHVKGRVNWTKTTHYLSVKSTFQNSDMISQCKLSVLITTGISFQNIQLGIKKCSDPCMRHKKPNTCRLSEISLDLALEVERTTEHRIIPGQKLCQHCLSHLRELISTNAEIVSDEDDDQAEEEQKQDDPAENEFDIFDSPQYDSPM